MTLLSEAPAVPGASPAASASDARPVVIDVCGDLDLSTVARIRERLEAAMAARPPHLVVDLSKCAFVDASALAMLLEAHRRTCRSGGRFTLRGCSPRVLRLLSLTGLRRVFDLD
jgi:anti-anti-sigma factor